MKRNGGGADSSFGPPLGERAVWDMDSPDHECECPGPPPQFYLPPPPRPASLVDADCSENSVSRMETCEAVPGATNVSLLPDRHYSNPMIIATTGLTPCFPSNCPMYTPDRVYQSTEESKYTEEEETNFLVYSMKVIDAEYHYSPAIPSLAIILTVAVAVVVFLLIGTFLVVLKKRKMQNLFPRKSSPQSRCDGSSANGVIYEDLTNIRPRTLSPHCPPGQTTLPSIEMIDVASYPDHGMFTPVFICPTTPVPDTYNSQDLFNPVYEELSNGSGDKGETDSEGLPQAAISEDEFAEDELSLGGEPEVRLREGGKQDDGGSSDADDRSRFLESTARSQNPSTDHRDKRIRTNRGPAKRSKSLDRRKIWRNKAPLPPPGPPVDCNEFHEGFLLKRILQIYPDVTGVGLQYSRGALSLPRSEEPPGSGRYESLAAFGHSHPRRPKPEIFFGKNHSQDSSLGSDSGYSNNTSGGKSSSKPRKEYRMPNHSDPVLS